MADAAICELLMMWDAYDNGGQRHHTLADLAITAGFYLGMRAAVAPLTGSGHHFRILLKMLAAVSSQSFR